MDHLKALAHEKFKVQLRQHWISDTFPDCIREVYNTTFDSDTMMRRAVIEVVNKNSKELCRKMAFREVIHDIGEFAVDLVDRLAGISFSSRY